MAKRKMDGSIDKRSENTRKIAQKAIAEKKTGRRFTALQVARQMQLVTDAWVEGANDTEITRMFREMYERGEIDHLVRRSRVFLLRERAQKRILDESESERPFTKSRQARRITKSLRDCKGVRGPGGKWIEKPDHMARARCEDMIARIEGNYEPVKIQVDAVHRHAITEIIASLTPEQMTHYEQSFDRIMELAANKAKELGEPISTLLPTPVQTTNGSVNGSANGSSLS